jgi:hypothetical protein
MLAIILCIGGLIFAVGASGIIVAQLFLVKTGSVIREEGYNGPAQVSGTLAVILRYLFKRSVHIRKFVLQYVFHTFVRMTYYLDTWSSYLYAKSRNLFVKNAVRNRGTVPHFWEHLKVYKQEMDKERLEDEV